MTKTFRRASLGALLMLAALPAMASAALTPGVSLNPVQAGCYPKGPLAIPNQAFGNIPPGQAQYKVAAVVNGQETAPCAALPSGAATNYGTFLQWAAAPGATAYRIYRNDVRIQELTPSAALCPPANAGNRCQFIDSTGQPAAGITGTPRALPTPVTQAGASPDLNIVQTFDYGGAGNAAGDDPAPNGGANSASLKDNILHFPPGLLANPTATTASCSINQLIGAPATQTGGAGTTDAAEDKCPRASQVGTVLAQIQSPPVVPQNPPTPTVGDIYIGEKLQSDGAGITARLFVALRPPCSAGYPAPLNPGGAACIQRFTQAGLPAQAAATAEVEKSFLSAKATIVRRNPATAASIAIDNETTSVSEGEDRDLAASSNIRLGNGSTAPSALPIQVRALTQTLFGQADQGTASPTDDKPFVILPTSCTAKTFSVDAASYLDPTLASANTALQATGCENVPFGPQITATLDARNETNQNGNPGFVARITQNSNEAATKAASVTLPKGLGANINALDRACTVAQAASAAGCPATSQVGIAAATTPVLPGTLSGPVYVAVNDSPYNLSGLPKLIVDLNGAARIKFEGTIGFDQTNTRLVNSFLDLPEVTLSSFTLAITGGDGGLLQNTQDLCDEPLGNIDAAFLGYNDKAVTRQIPTVSNQEYYCIPDVDPPTKKKAGLTLKVKPKTDKRKPFKFTASGKVLRKGAARGQACRGRVSITVKKGKKTLDRARASVKRNCSYKAKLKLSKKAGKRGKAVVRARFNGNSVLKKSKTVKKTVKYGTKKGKKGKKGKGNK